MFPGDCDTTSCGKNQRFSSGLKARPGSVTVLERRLSSVTNYLQGIAADFHLKKKKKKLHLTTQKKVEIGSEIRAQSEESSVSVSEPLSFEKSED